MEVIDEKEAQDKKKEKVSKRRSADTPHVEATLPDDLHQEEAVAAPDTPELLSEPVENHDEPEQRKRPRPLYKRPVVLVIAAIVFLVGAIVGVRYWLYARSHESTDDAFIDGHIIQISPKASGYVSKLYVTDNQEVKAGDLLVELDARDYEARLERAKAALAAGLAKL